ncbi:MAG: hypothetical protein Q9227_003404 [Pyrenula ochraceoflavens]
MLLTTLPRATLPRPPLLHSPSKLLRPLSTLQSNPHIYIHPSTPTTPQTHTLSLLPTSPPTPALSLGTTTTLPPTPDSFTENPHFLTILHSVLATHASSDPSIQSQAAALASTAGSHLGSGGSSLFNSPNRRPAAAPHRRKNKTNNNIPEPTDTQSGASGEGGAGGGGRGGFIHVSDLRHPPDYGRIAEPEDIFGSLEVDGAGEFVEPAGRYQASGTYRVVTRDGVLGLTEFLRGKVVERLKLEEQAREGAG